MDIAIKNEKRMDLMGRSDYTIRVAYQGSTPGRSKVVKAVAKELKAKEDMVVIRTIMPEFGSSSSIVDASVYDSQEKIDQFESGYVKQRHERATAKDAEAKAAEEEAKKKAEEEAAAAKAEAEAAAAEEAEAPAEETPSEEASEKKGDAE